MNSILSLVKPVIPTFVLTIFSIICLNAQNNSAFYANANAKEVLQGTDFSVEFVMNNIQGTNFQPPVFNNFDVISGPNRTSSYQNINGKVSQQLKLNYILRPKTPGNYIIGSATCIYNNQKLSTLPFEIKVLKRDEKALTELGLPTDKELFVRMEISKDTAYIGEKVEVNFKLYTSKPVRSYDMVSEPDYPGFFVRNKPIRNRESGVEIINGINYSTQILETRLLYPQQNGTTTFQPAEITLGLPDPNATSSYLFRSNNIPYPVTTNSASITIVNLPANAPKSFSGAVGSCEIQSSIDKRELSTDDAITLSMTVKGNGDSKYLLPPNLSMLSAFEVYDPNTIYEDTHERFGELQTVKTFQYLLVPKISGKINLIPEFSYYDVDKKAYITLKSDTFEINVSQGKNKVNRTLAEENTEARSLTGLLTTSTLKKGDRIYFGGILHLSLVSIALFAVGFMIFEKRKLDKIAGIDPSVKKRKKAKTVAEKRLTAAKNHMIHLNYSGFYNEISKSILGFIADKLNVPASEISKANVAKRLKDSGIDDHLIEKVTTILTEAEIAIFAGKKSGEMIPTYDTTIAIIDELNLKI